MTFGWPVVIKGVNCLILTSSHYLWVEGASSLGSSFNLYEHPRYECKRASLSLQKGLNFLKQFECAQLPTVGPD